MAEVTINNSPVHSDSILTAVYRRNRFKLGKISYRNRLCSLWNNSCKSSSFSVCEGTVYSKTFDNTLGNQIIIQDTNTGNYWRYCHMQSPSTLNVGENVTTLTQVGIMGDTRKCNRNTFTFRVCNFSCLEL